MIVPPQLGNLCYAMYQCTYILNSLQDQNFIISIFSDLQSRQHLGPVHLPGQNVFCPGQNIFCTGQNNFGPRQNIFVQDKNFCPRLKSSYLLEKRIENDFKLWRNFFPWLKSYFPSISQAKCTYLA